MIRNVLVTGAGGRIARSTIPLFSPEWDLLLTDREPGEVDGRPIHALDITDYEAVCARMAGVDAVLHLAIAASREIVTDKERFDADEGEEYLRFNQLSLEVNVRGTYHIFEAARQAGVKRVVYGSSLTVLFGQPQYPAFHDDLPPRPFNFYAVTKLWGEQLGEYFSRRHGMTVYGLRFSQPYPMEADFSLEGANAKRHDRRILVSYPDLAGAMECALTCQTGPAFGVYAIVSDSATPRCDCSKAEEIGWKPKTRCEPGGQVVTIAS